MKNGNAKTANKQAKRVSAKAAAWTVGIDLGDRKSHYCVLNRKGEMVEEGQVRTRRQEMAGFLEQWRGAEVVIEASTHSPWVHDLIVERGQKAVVANMRELPRLRNKTDREDARRLARMGRADRELLKPIWHRPARERADLAVVRSREQLMTTRTALVNHVRGLVKSYGERLPGCASEAFVSKCAGLIPEPLRAAAEPILRALGEINRQIKELNKTVARLCQQYEETRLLRTVPGVGELTALTYRLTVSDPGRFACSRNVGAYLGLKPGRAQSGEQDPQLGISKTGDRLLRRLLAQVACYILGPFAPDSALRQWGLKLKQAGLKRNGKNKGHRRAMVAVARKLAVILHRMWVKQEAWQAFPSAA